MMHIVVVGTSPERQDVVQAPWELISRVGIDGLEQSKNDPGVHGKDMEVLCDSRPQYRHTDATKGQNHDFYGGSIFCGKAKWSAVLMVQLVDLLV